MGLTRFPHGILATPVIGGSLPVIRGDWYFVNPDTTYSATQNPYPGSSSNPGTWEQPMDSVVTAYGTCVDGKGDGICLLGGGTSTAECTSYLTAALTWSKSAITVYGACAPTRFSQRARISTQAVNLANLITVSGSNNAFYNISLYNGGTTGAGCVKVTGDRNYFGNVHFMGGMGMTTPTVNDYDLYIDGGDENTFENCVIGSDTFDKTDIAGAELLVGSGAMRNRFYFCEFVSFRSAGTTAAIIKLVGAGDSITRTMYFDNCFFQMYRDGDVTAEAVVVIGTAPNNGFIVFKDCVRHGFTDWAGVATARVYSASPTYAEAGGISIAANPS
ncbi:MAG: hypothetical protein PHY29_03100 [Syntrophales bacterium]|nr:hypothetical protein [Syntrophales bacterium]